MAKTALTPVESTGIDERWEAWKAAGLEAKSAVLHQAVDICGKMERSIIPQKFQGIKMWWAPQGLLIEINQKRISIAAANVAKCDH